jgi:hypothetical protein
MDFRSVVHLLARQEADKEDKDGGQKLLDLLKDPFSGQVAYLLPADSRDESGLLMLDNSCKPPLSTPRSPFHSV